MNRTFTSIIFSAGIFLMACGKDKPVVQEIIRPVRYIKVYATGGSQVRAFSGAARSGIESNLSFRVPGTVQAVPVKVGDKVKRGQLLARLDSKDYELQVQQARAALSQARAQRLKASADYDRLRQLYETNSAPRSQLDAARAAYESASAGVDASRKQLELTQSRLGYTRLLAPVAGAIAAVNIEVNENARAGQPVVRLMAGSNIEVEVAVPEILISRIKQGNQATVTFDAIAGKNYSAIVREVGIASTAFATTFAVTVRLENSAPDIRSGMAAEVAFRFESSDRRERITLPPFAVGEDRDGRFVFIVQPANADTAIVKRVAVEIGALSSEGIEVLRGLADGDLVVTAGVSKIKDGQRVRL